MVNFTHDSVNIDTPAFAITKDHGLVNHARDKESFAYARGVYKVWGGLEPMLSWCKSELTADWRWQMVEMSTDQRPGYYIFYFDSDRDCAAFTLKWC